MLLRWRLLLPILVLATISLLIIASVSPGLARTQAIFFVAGAVIFTITSQIPFHWWLRWRWLMYTGVVALLSLTLLIAPVTRGSTRWIQIAGINVQPSQLVVPTVSLVIASWVSKTKTWRWRPLLNILAITLLPALLIMAEPDLDTTLVYLVAAAVGFWLSPLQKKHWLFFITAGITVLASSWLFLQDYQKQRILSFLSPNTNLQSSGYNAQQSLIAVGSGQIWGRGVGYGTQSQLRFLPERQTDFIFASLSEELGFVGSATVLVLYALIIALLLRAANNSHLVANLFITMISAWLTSQAFINIGMNIGLLPISGITLPLLSYGGSSILTTCWSLGLAAAAGQQRQTTVRYLS